MNGAEGESLDPKATKPKKTKQPSLDDLFAEADAKAKEDEQNAANEAAAAEEEEVKPAPKKRGRKSKKELEEIAAREVAEAEAEAEAKAKEEAQETAEAPATEEVIPEASADTSVDIDPKAIEELQAKMAQQQPAANQGVTPDGVWEGDPGDGTDFITVVDLPIEDGEAIPTLDIFDRPMNQAAQTSNMADMNAYAPSKAFGGNTKYNFELKRLQLPVVARRYLCEPATGETLRTEDRRRGGLHGAPTTRQREILRHD